MDTVCEYEQNPSRDEEYSRVKLPNIDSLSTDRCNKSVGAYFCFVVIHECKVMFHWSEFSTGVIGSVRIDQSENFLYLHLKTPKYCCVPNIDTPFPNINIYIN